MATRTNTQRAVISSSASGDVTIIANPSTKAFMNIWEVFIQTGGTANLTFKNGAGAITGAIGVTSTTPPISFQDGGSGTPRFVIDPGASFIVNDSAGVGKNGYCIYSN